MTAEENEWFGAKEDQKGAKEEIVVDDEEDGVGSGMVAAADEENAENGEKREEKRKRRVSLAQRFSMGSARKQSEEEGQEKQKKSQAVWQKLKRMSLSKHRPVSPTAAATTEGGGSNDTVVAVEGEAQPSSVDSASTVAETNEPAAITTDTSKPQPTGLIIAAPPLAV